METQDKNLKLLKDVQEKRIKVEALAKKLKKKNSRYVLISIIGSSLATLLAGLTAIYGPLAGAGAPAWKITCGAIAGLTAFSGIFAGLHQKLAIPEHLSRCYACSGRLNALELALTVFNRDISEVAKEYQDITSNYNELFLE